MPMQMKCPNPACTTMLTVREEFAGKMIKCPTCASTLMVPQPAVAAAVGAAPIGGGAPVAPSMPSPDPTASATPIPPEMSRPAASPVETLWALIDKNGLDKKSQVLLAAGIGAMLFFLFSMLLPRLNVAISAEAFGTKVGEKSWSDWWILTIPGVLFFLGTLMDMAFIAASFAKMHVFLRYSFMASAAWGAFLLVCLFFIFIFDALSGGDAGGNVKKEVSIGIGTYFAVLACLGITGAFGLLAYPEVMKLVKQAKPAA